LEGERPASSVAAVLCAAGGRPVVRHTRINGVPLERRRRTAPPLHLPRPRKTKYKRHLAVYCLFPLNCPQLAFTPPPFDLRSVVLIPRRINLSANPSQSSRAGARPL